MNDFMPLAAMCFIVGVAVGAILVIANSVDVNGTKYKCTKSIIEDNEAVCEIYKRGKQ